MTAPALDTDSRLLRAVVVDDTSDIRLLLRMALEKDGEIKVVAEAANGREGIEAASAWRPDLVLLDLAMPVMDGLEALPSIRHVCPGATIVVLSGFDAATLAEPALAAGADGYVQKGLGVDEIVARVLELAGRNGPPAAATVPRPRLDHERVVTAAPAPPPAVLERVWARAPFGVVVADHRGPAPVVVACLNPAAAALLHADPTVDGQPLEHVSPELAALSDQHRQALRNLQEVNTPLSGRDGRLEVRLRPEQDLLFVYVAPASPADEATALRTAISAIAHEMRNPATILVGVAQTLIKRGAALSEENRNELLTAIANQARLLSHATSDLLTAAQAQHGSVRIDRRQVRLRRVIESAVSGQPDASGVTVDCDPDLQLRADPARLEQMIGNLVSNAIKYGAPPVRVVGNKNGGTAYLRVEDGGPGVPEAFLPLLFSEFARAPDVTVRGSGLGLFVVRTLAEAHGGTVTYERRAEGGSVFVLALPQSGREDSP